MIHPEQLNSSAAVEHNFNGNGKFTYSGRHNPCPICGRTKDQDCHWNLEVVFCHTYTDQDAGVSGYVYRGAKDIWGQYFPQETSQKPIRPKSTKSFFYNTIDGQPLVKVTRSDRGDGNKSFYQSHWNGTAWVKGLNEQVKSEIHLYQIQDPINQDAIATGEPVLIVEGEGKVDLLLPMGIAATCSIGGALKWRHYGYPNYLEDLAGANVILCPDRDKAGLKHCEDIALDFPDAKWLYALPNSPLWQRVPDKGGFDIADWITVDGATREDILGAIADKRHELEKLIEPSERLAHSANDHNKPCKLAGQFQEVQSVLGHRLRLNTLRKQIELDTEPINPDRIHLKLANDFNLQIPRSNALDIVTELAEQRSYSPVAEYLTRVYDQYGGNSDILKTIASRYFGTDNPIYDTYLQKTLVAAAARAMQPGCKMDTALILQGKQGVGKSSFFKVLAGENWFDDSLGHISDKDERLKLHVTWFIEWAELESVFKRRDLASVKAFLTCSRDYIRPPYGRSVQAFDRPSIIVGTTNQDEFLGDSTGNRRFWVVPVQQEVDLNQLRTERDRIWAAAVTLYLSGESWWLSQGEEQTAEALREDYQVTDPWLDAIIDYINHPETEEPVTTEAILNGVLRIETGRQEQSHKVRVANILKQLGWENKLKKVDGQVKRVWLYSKKIIV